jgi:hypothetical protein
MARRTPAGRTGRGRGDEPVRITSAPTNRAEEIAARQRRYLFSMGVRTVCFIGAVLVGQGVLRWILVGAAVLLPYVAVVIANTAGERDDGYRPETPGYHPELPGRK